MCKLVQRILCMNYSSFVCKIMDKVPQKGIVWVPMDGRLIASLIGLAILIVGIVLCATVIGAIIGIPLVIFGFLLMIRGIF